MQKLRQSDEAIAASQTSLKIFQDNVVALNNLANVYSMLGKIAEAIKYYEILDPDFVTALHNLGTVNLTTGSDVEALKYFERAIDPKFVPASGNLAVIHLGKGEKEETIHNLQKILEIDLPSGVYFYRIKAGEFVQTKKLTLLK